MKIRKLLLLAVAMVFFGTVAVSVRAEEVSASDLKLVNTYLKASNDSLMISSTPIDALTSTAVNCPQPGPCVLEIEFATQVSGLTPPDPNVTAAVVTVDGSAEGISPCSACGLDSTSTGGGSNVRSYVWMAQGLRPGHHSVVVQLYATEGTSGSATRSVKVNVYLQARPESMRDNQ